MNSFIKISNPIYIELFLDFYINSNLAIPTIITVQNTTEVRQFEIHLLYLPRSIISIIKYGR